MTKGRLEAFSDGVIAVVITIMVLELHVPTGADWAALAPLWQTFATYALSFVYVGIYWNNHHHMLHTVERVNGGILWANLHLLFWLSLIPFTTGWAGHTHFASVPTAVYGAVLFMSGIAYTILAQMIIAHDGPESALAKAVGRDVKGQISAVLYLVGAGVAFLQPHVSAAIYVVVALMWLVPDRRIERNLQR